ncbi:undecaprenyl-diphosphate phosphatase [Candidatus Woesebacteria bacterium]|nr:undecaprenyl-diphosphate phosphatase [Candidatus Woesebacteria bacterium]
MNALNYILLGVVQGLTEFLPVSSSGHLVIFQSILPGVNEPGIILEAFLHAGTLLSVIYFFRKTFFRKNIKYWILICISTIPAVLVGLFLNDHAEKLFTNIRVVGVALLITGFINFATGKIRSKIRESVAFEKFNMKDISNSLIIGVFQAVAIVPGISRSGSTIFAGRKLGLSKNDAAQFSFLMSIPAILGANAFEFVTSNKINSDFNYLYLIGFIFSFLSGVIAIKIVIRFLETAKYEYFSFYVFIVGVLVLIIS